MPIEPPNLDDRTFDQIHNEMLLRIPHYTPEWTDWNESDPGATLIELFAWLAETIGYRLNQAPERSLLTFLQVLGIEPVAASPAATDLTFTVRDGELRPIPIPAGTPVSSSVSTENGPIVFETERGVDLIPLRLRSIQVAGPNRFDVISTDEAAYTAFRPFGGDPQHGDALYLGFGPAEPTAAVEFPQQISLLIDPPKDRQGAVTDARLQWEFRSDPDSDRWSPLGLIVDESQAFTRSGYVQIAGPRTSAAVAGVGREDRPMHWLRCRFVSGQYPPGQEPVIELLRHNTVPARSLTTVGAERAGTSDGRTGQVFRLKNRPLPEPDAATVDVADPAGGTDPAEIRWAVVRDLIESGPDDRHVVVDGSRGELRFGDGRNGRVPVAGFEILVGYRYGGTVLANVPAGEVEGLQTAPPGIDAVTNQRKSEGGRDEETAAELKRRAPAALRSRDRAVTAEDYRELARKVGGVADAVAIGMRHPNFPDTAVPGSVLVAVLARSTDRVPAASPGLLEAVADELAPKRAIGTELHVRGARFVEVEVTTVIQVAPFAAVGEIVAEAQRRIDAQLSPSGGGRFGVSFFPTSLFGVLQQIPDVLAVPALEVRIDDAEHRLDQEVVIAPDQLIVPAANHRIDVRTRSIP
ncbi:putative baseplate assembly protein [Actinoplanes sp. NPDC023936]|uniref:putative baseplate assembly protein n=1 Tax=Actinoplanes sp. NPDC023936 TaxID=3154910 RepID=UPI0033C93CB1